MAEIIGYCGLTCHTCPIYLATREENVEERERIRAEVARMCREQYGLDYRPEDINDCDGCLADKRLFTGCAACAIRTCARERELESCAYCADYDCDKLAGILNEVPDARTRLDGLRNANP
jgi:hypothetical protein